MFSPFGLPFVMEGVIDELDNLIHSLSTGKVDMVKLLKHKATLIDPDNKVVTAIDMDTNEEKTIPYDSAIIATGSSPFVPPIQGADEYMVHDFYGVELAYCPAVSETYDPLSEACEFAN